MIVIPAQISGLNTLKDHSIKISLITNEPTPQQFADLFSLKTNGFCYLALKEEMFTNSEHSAINDLKADPFKDWETQSPSKRLRSVLYVKWIKNGEVQGTGKEWDTYYHVEMDKLITKQKDLIPD